MDTHNLCQSCSMPVDNISMQGTEKDGTRSKEYCIYCYKNGSFVNPEMTLAEMSVVVESQMEKRNISKQLISAALNILPELKRWKTAKVY